MKLRVCFLLFVLNVNISFSLNSQTQIGQTILGEYPDFRIHRSTISNLGNKIAIGGNYSVGANIDNDIRVYEYENKSWSQVGNDISPQARYRINKFAFSGNGNRIAISEYRNTRNHATLDGIKIFQFDGVQWAQIGNTIKRELGYDIYYEKLSLSDDGNRIAISGSFRDSLIHLKGRVRIFEYNGQEWQKLGETIFKDNNVKNLGFQMSFSGDGKRIAVSNYVTTNGKVTVFEYINGNWKRVGEVIQNDVKSYSFGRNISLSSDGGRIAISSNLGNSKGQVLVYNYFNGSWIKTKSNIVGEDDYDNIDLSIAMSGDGKSLSVASPDNHANKFSGLVRAYELKQNKWLKSFDDMVGKEKKERFGSMLSLSQNGEYLAVVSPGSRSQKNKPGHIKIFKIK